MCSERILAAHRVQATVAKTTTRPRRSSATRHETILLSNPSLATYRQPADSVEADIVRTNNNTRSEAVLRHRNLNRLLRRLTLVRPGHMQD